MLGVAIEFVAIAIEIEDVNGDLAFRVNQRNLYVAVTFGESQGKAAQQARTVLRDNLQQRAVAR